MCLPTALFLGDQIISCFSANVDDVIVNFFGSELSILMKNNKGKHGLAIVTGMINDGPSGTEKDMVNMKRAFEKLGLAVWSFPDPSDTKITAVIRAIGKYPFHSDYKFIIFYATGYGGSMGSHAFISTVGHVDDNGRFPRLFIEKAIISPLLPKNMLDTCKSMRRIFLFDCCLLDDTINGDAPVIKQKDISIPPQDNVLVAYCTFMTGSARADEEHGGIWTRFLAHNMVKFDLPFTTVLDITWEDTVKHFREKCEQENCKKTMDVQAPHYTSCAGLIWLQRKWTFVFLPARLPTLDYSLKIPFLNLCADPDWDKSKCPSTVASSNGESKRLPYYPHAISPHFP